MEGKNRFLDRLTNRPALRRWARAARLAESCDLAELRAQRQHARRLRSHLDKLIFVADGRLALPSIGPASLPAPNDSDWSYRPELWCGPLRKFGMSSVASGAYLGRELKVFHDCAEPEISLRQIRNSREADLAPFGLQMDVFNFDGSYLSLVIDLPQSAAHNLKRRHLFRMDVIVELERPLKMFARLNIKHGPNEEQVVRELPLNRKSTLIEFDLAYTGLNEKRVEHLWVDLIFEEPAMNQVVLRDLTFSRRPRAEL
jgi:hypothetical protein